MTQPETSTATTIQPLVEFDRLQVGNLYKVFCVNATRFSSYSENMFLSYEKIIKTHEINVLIDTGRKYTTSDSRGVVFTHRIHSKLIAYDTFAKARFCVCDLEGKAFSLYVDEQVVMFLGHHPFGFKILWKGKPRLLLPYFDEVAYFCFVDVKDV